METDPIYAELGDLVRRRRKSLDRTQADLARQLGMSRASLANIETGRQRVLVHQLYQLAEALEFDVYDLLPLRRRDDAEVEPTDWRLPPDLTAEQQQQVARLLENPATGSPLRKSGGGD